MVKNKMAVINVLSGIIQNPLLLMDENYKLTPDDFPERFHKIVFAAVDHLAHNGVKETTKPLLMIILQITPSSIRFLKTIEEWIILLRRSSYQAPAILIIITTR